MKNYQAIIIALCSFFIFGCSQTQQTNSPTEVLKNLNEASKTRDVEAVKNSVSKGTLALMEDSAKKQNTTVDELLKKDNGVPFKELPETRNEKIEGDTATLELKNTTTGGWETVPFVKEDGSWRLALDKYMKDLQKAAESLKASVPNDNESDANASVPDANKKPSEAANKPATSKK